MRGDHYQVYFVGSDKIGYRSRGIAKYCEAVHRHTRQLTPESSDNLV
jgi:hypothetical protein